MTPEEFKKLKIIMATFKFDIAEIIDEKISEIVALREERSKTEAIRRRERRW